MERVFCEQFLRTTSEQAANARTFLFRDSSQPGQCVISLYQNGQFEHNLMSLEQFRNWPVVLSHYGLHQAHPDFCAVVSAIRRSSINHVTLFETKRDKTWGPIAFHNGPLLIRLNETSGIIYPDLSPVEQAIIGEFIKRSKSVKTLQYDLTEGPSLKLCPRGSLISYSFISNPIVLGCWILRTLPIACPRCFKRSRVWSR